MNMSMTLMRVMVMEGMTAFERRLMGSVSSIVATRSEDDDAYNDDVEDDDDDEDYDDDCDEDDGGDII